MVGEFARLKKFLFVMSSACLFTNAVTSSRHHPMQT